MYSNKANSVHVESADNNNYNNSSINSERDSCFNPNIYFACKFCRQSTRNVDELILHKRLKHTAQELRGIKFIIFEETFGKPEFDDPDQLLPFSSESEDFIRENTLISNSKKSNHIERRDDSDQYNIVNNIDNRETVSNSYQSKKSNLPNPYVSLERLTLTEINSFSNSSISGGINHYTQHSRSRKQTSTPSHLTDVQIPRSIHNGEIVHFIGTKRNSRSVFPAKQENRLEISNSKRCKIIETGDELIRKQIESGDVVNSSGTNDKWTGDDLNENEISNFQIESSNTMLSRLLSGEPVDLNPTCSDVFNITDNGIGGGDDLIEDTQELEDGEFIVAHIIKDCDGTEKVEFLSTDSPTIEEASPVSAVITTEYDYAVNHVSHVINEFHGIITHEDLREIERPSRYIAELDTSTLVEKECLPHKDLSNSADFHEDYIEDNESDFLTPIDENYSTEPPISEPILTGTCNGTGENSSQTEGFNLQMHTQNTIHKLFTENEVDLDLNKLAESDPAVTTTNLTSVFVPEPILTQSAGASNFNESGLNKLPSTNICTPILDVDFSTPVSQIKSKPPQEKPKDEVPPNVQSTSRYNTRTRRNPSKISYSENHSCLTCNTDFYTIEDLETHEKKCSILNGDTRKSSRFKNTNKTGLGLLDDKREGKEAEDEDIQVITFKSKTVKPVQDLVSDDDYIPDNYNSDQASNGNDSGSENDDDQQKEKDCVFDSTEATEYDQKPPQQNQMPNRSPIPRPQISRTEDDLELSISFTEWLKKQAKNHPKRIFRLEPDPLAQDQTQASVDTNSATFIITAENPIKCKLCSLKLYSEFDARYHLKWCSQFNKKSHKYCLKCEKSFRVHYQLRYHTTTKHPKPGTPPIVCDVCHKELATQCSLTHHKLFRCSKDPIPKNFVCEVCGNTFVHSAGLRRHKLVHSEDRPFKCNLCPRAFKTKDSWRGHEGTHSRKYECPLCLNTLATKTGLSNHMKTHTGELRFSCSVPNCSLKFPQKYAMETHCIKDHGFPKFACTETDCSKSFFSSQVLYTHKLTTHSSPDKFKCTENGCSRTFKHKSTMIEHVRTHTGETPYQCDTCGNTYTKQWSFQKHLRVHTDSHNKFSCDKCPRKFPGSWELKQHLLIHEKGKQFKCDQCGFNCMTKANLKGHLKVHEGSPRKRGRKNKKSELEESETETDSETESEIEKEKPENTDTESDLDLVVEGVLGNGSSEKISNKFGSAGSGNSNQNSDQVLYTSQLDTENLEETLTSSGKSADVTTRVTRAIAAQSKSKS